MDAFQELVIKSLDRIEAKVDFYHLGMDERVQKLEDTTLVDSGKSQVLGRVIRYATTFSLTVVSAVAIAHLT